MGRVLNPARVIFAGALGETVDCCSTGFTLVSIGWEHRCLRRFTTKGALAGWACIFHAALIPGRTTLFWPWRRRQAVPHTICKCSRGLLYPYVAYFATMYYVCAVCLPVNDAHANAMVARNGVISRKPGMRELGECPSAGSLNVPVQYSPTIGSDPSWQARWERLIVENMRPCDAINTPRRVVLGQLTSSRGKSQRASMPNS